MSDERQPYERGEQSNTWIFVTFIIILLIIVVGILAAVTATAPDASRLVYAEKEDGTLEVTEIKNTYKDGWFCRTSLTVPEEVDGKRVTSVARLDSAKLQTIILPESVTEIKARAFSDCTSLSELVWSDGITSIGDGALQNCSSLKSIRLPAGVTEIKAKTFSGCSSLSEITWSGAIASIGASAFQNCRGLTVVSIPEGVTSIAASAFQGCDRLTKVAIPATVAEIGAQAFADCAHLLEADFKQTDGWTAGGEEALAGLESAQTAAEWLTQEYKDKTWKRS